MKHMFSKERVSYACPLVSRKRYDVFYTSTTTSIGVSDFPNQCPSDSVLFQLPGWDACMTWRLANGTTILQNFVMKSEDCTPGKFRIFTAQNEQN